MGCNKIRIVLINPPQPYLLDPITNPPLGLMYLGAFLREQGHDVEIIEMADGIKDVPDANVYGITAVTPSFNHANHVAELVRLKDEDALIVIGGPHITAIPHDIVTSNFDIGIIGEGEYTFDDLLLLSIDHVNGVIYKSFGGYQVNPSRAPIENLDDLPYPSRELVDIHSYHRKVAGIPATTMITSRGCPFECIFCDNTMWGKNYRCRSVRDIIGELLEIRDAYGFEAVLFVDDEFTLYPKFPKLLKEIKKLDMTWRCWTRADLVGQNVLRMMKEAGCEEIAFGVESGSQKILDNLNKNITVKRNVDAIKWAKDVGITTKIFLMVGSPGENLKTIGQTSDFIIRTQPDDWILSTFVPMPGSAAFREPEKYGIKILDDNYSNYVEAGLPDQEPVMELDTASRPEIKLFRELLRFRLRKHVKHKVG